MRRKIVIDAVDLFCGGGGLTCGLRQAGINVKMGVDFDLNCKYAYEHNNKARFLHKSILDVTAKEVKANFRKGHYSLLAGCAPCQTFSSYNPKATYHDKRWHLLSHFQRLAAEVRPDFVTMENVPNIHKQKVFRDFVRTLKQLGYNVDYKIVNCPKYGLPQLRKRIVLMASRLGKIVVPPPKKNVRVKTVREIIGGLPPIKAGGHDTRDRLHFCASLSALNLKRIKVSDPGGTWKSWPSELVAKCHKRKAGRSFRGVYGRMEWDKPAPTMTTEFFGFGHGRFGHPDQDRAISIREGAMFQGFPRWYQFYSAKEKPNIAILGKMIGNAVPVKLGEAIGKAFLRHVGSYERIKRKEGDNDA